MKKYILKYAINDVHGNIFPKLSMASSPNISVILNKSRKHNKFFEKNTRFSPLIPVCSTDNFENRLNIYNVPDLISWYGSAPTDFCRPISKRFCNLLRQFNLQPLKIYEAEVLLNNQLFPFNVIHLPVDYYKEKLIDFEHSTFCNWNGRRLKQLSTENEKIESFEFLYPLKKEKKWRNAGFNKAVMKPEFAKLDLVITVIFSGLMTILISERLKNAIEAAKLTGIKITECPIDFEISDKGAIVDVSTPKTPIIPVILEKTATLSKPSEVCYFPDGLKLSYQSAVDDFKKQYPVCKKIIGNVDISGGVGTLEGLSEIEEIDGCLRINAEEIETLEGLSNLHTIGGELYITDTRELTSLKGLENLKIIRSSGRFYWSPEEQGIAINDNKVLEDISALRNIERTAYNLYIANNPKLKSLKGLEALTFVGRSLVVEYNQQLEDIVALKNIKRVKERIAITNNPNLKSLSGLENILSECEVFITNNRQMKDIFSFSDFKKTNKGNIS